MMCANVDKHQVLVTKIGELNRASREGDIIKPALLREHNALTSDDYKEFASWLISLSTVPKKVDINTKLTLLRKLSLARWHVFQAPDVVIVTEKNMCLFYLLIHCIIFFFHRKRSHCAVHCGQGPTEWLSDRQLG